jgi:hypothetical protein
MDWEEHRRDPSMSHPHIRLLGFYILAGTVSGQGMPWGRAVPIRQQPLSSYSMAPKTDGGVVSVCPVMNARTGCQDLLWESFDAALAGREVRLLVSDIPSFTAIQIAASPGGDFIFCWDPDDGHRRHVQSRRYDTRGQETGPPVQVSATGVENVYPRAAVLANGGAVVCWTRNRAGVGSDIMARLFTADGISQGTEFTIRSASSGPQGFPYPVGLNDGGFAVLWSGFDEDAGKRGVFLGCFNERGDRRGDAVKVFDDFEGAPCVQPIAVLRNGVIVVCGTGRDPADPSHSHVHFQPCFQEGGKSGPVVRVNVQSDRDSRSPSVIPLENGGFALVWEEMDIRAPYLDHVALKCYDALFNPSVDEMRVDDSGMDGYLTSVCPLYGGGFVVAWQEADGMLFMKPFRDEPLVHTLVPFTALTPKNDASLTADSCEFQWRSATRQPFCYPQEMRYTVLLDENPDFQTPQRRTVDKDTFLAVSDLRPGATYFWKVLARNTAGDSLWSSNTNGFFVSLTGIRVGDPSPSAAPKCTGLLSNFPNPFNPRTMIAYILARDASVRLSILDVRGRLIRRLACGRKSSGLQTIEWDGCDDGGRSASGGIYLAVLEAEGMTDSRKILLVK